MKKLSLLLALVLILGLFAGCGDSAPTSREYTLECGITLTAESGLTEKEQPAFTTSLQGRNSMILFLEESKAMLGGDMDLEQYADIIVSGNRLTEGFAEDASGNYATSYTRDVDGSKFFYYVTVHETASSFWMVQMACMESKQETYEPLFREWAATIQIPETEGSVDTTISETDFTMTCGLTITMADDMAKMNLEGYDEFYTNNTLGLILLQEEKPEGWTLDDYAAAVAEANGMDALEKDAYGNPATTYTYENEGIVYHYYLTAHEFSDRFVLCQFFCVESALEIYGDYMTAWSDTLSE